MFKIVLSSRAFWIWGSDNSKKNTESFLQSVYPI